MTFYNRILLIAVTILWGFNFIVVRWGVEGVTASSMTIFHFSLTAFPIVFFVKRPNTPMLMVAMYGILFGAVIRGMINIAVSSGLPAGKASLLLQMSVFFSLLAAIFIYKEPFDKMKKIGIALIFVGYITILQVNTNDIELRGAIFIALAALAWTGCNIIIRYCKPDDIVSFIAWSSLFVPVPIVAGILIKQYISMGFILWSEVISIPNMQGWISILFQAYISTILGYKIWIKLVSEYGLSNVTPYSLLVPISGLFFGWWVYNEVLTNMEIISAIIIAGLSVLSAPSFYKNIIIIIRFKK